MKKLVLKSLNTADSNHERSLIIYDNHFEHDEKKEEAQNKLNEEIKELLGFTYKELVSQVSLQCQERGYLLEKIVSMMLSF